jgi:hypothetical protein
MASAARGMSSHGHIAERRSGGACNDEDGLAIGPSVPLALHGGNGHMHNRAPAGIAVGRCALIQQESRKWLVEVESLLVPGP